MILSGIFLKEKITWRLVAGTLLCTGGTILLVIY
jgi:drug/metabolite transporter (DMT)-like permease